MIEGDKFMDIAKAYFAYLVKEFGFEILSEKISGNAFYDLQYSDKIRVVSISYENMEDYLQVLIFNLNNGDMPDYEDKTRTLHINILNEDVLPNIDKGEIYFNTKYFSGFIAQSELERKMLKLAKELRLCLKYSKKLQIP
jgi:hypothetical protein